MTFRETQYKDIPPVVFFEKVYMERGPEEIKRRRIVDVELEIVTTLRNGLDLSSDMMRYMLDFLDIHSLHAFSGTYAAVHHFIRSERIWRKRFEKMVYWNPVFIDGRLISDEYWMEWWDRLYESVCPEGYRLAMAFRICFEIPRNGTTRMQKWIGPNDHNVLAVVLRYIPLPYTQLALLDIGRPMEMHVLFPNIHPYQKEFRDIMTKIGAYVEPDQFIAILPKNMDVVQLFYMLLLESFKPANFRLLDLRSECTWCAAPNPQGICGSCDEAFYCNQKCANAHWGEHNCVSLKEK